MRSRMGLRLLVSALFILASGCATLFIVNAFEPVAINKACGEEQVLPFQPNQDDKFLTLIARNTGGCPIELVNRPPAPAAEQALLSVPRDSRRSVTVSLPQQQLVAKCGPAAGARCDGEVRMIPSRKVKDGGDTTLKLVDGLAYEGRAGACDRSAVVFEHKNMSGKRQQLVIEARNTGDCDDFIVRANDQTAVTARKGGGAATSGEFKLPTGRTLTIEVTCAGETTTAGQCKGEVTVTLNRMK